LRRWPGASLVAALLALGAFASPASASEAKVKLKDVSVRPQKVDTWQSDARVIVELRATSKRGIRYLQVEFSNRARETPIPLFEEHFELQRGTKRNGVWRAKMPVPRYSEQGRWRLQTVSLAEGHTAIRRYLAPELRRRGLAKSFFQVGADDDHAPVLEDFEITPTEYDVESRPSYLDVYMLASDDLSGIDMVMITIRGPVNLGGYGWPYDRRSPRTRLVVPMPMGPSPKPGTYYVSVELRDRTGNVRNYSSQELAASGWTSQLVWR